MRPVASRCRNLPHRALQRLKQPPPSSQFVLNALLLLPRNTQLNIDRRSIHVAVSSHAELLCVSHAIADAAVSVLSVPSRSRSFRSREAATCKVAQRATPFARTICECRRQAHATSERGEPAIIKDHSSALRSAKTFTRERALSATQCMPLDHPRALLLEFDHRSVRDGEGFIGRT
jgi:hypothetical protein